MFTEYTWVKTRMIRYYSKKFSFCLEEADVSQEVEIAWGMAIDSWNKSTGVKFSTYAWLVINRHLAKCCMPAALPVHVNFRRTDKATVENIHVESLDDVGNHNEAHNKDIWENNFSTESLVESKRAYDKIYAVLASVPHSEAVVAKLLNDGATLQDVAEQSNISLGQLRGAIDEAKRRIANDPHLKEYATWQE